MTRQSSATLLDEIKRHTEVANQLSEKVRRWNAVTRSLVDLIAIYDGHEYKTELETLYANIVIEKANRCEHMIVIITQERERAHVKQCQYHEMRLD